MTGRPHRGERARGGARARTGAGARAPLLWAAVAALLAAACPSRERAAGSEDGAPPGAEPPTVTVDASGLVLSYIDDEGTFRVVASVPEVPDAYRGVVRVQDPSRPPPDTETVWIADLTAEHGGAFPVRAGSRAELERMAQSRRPAFSPAPADARPAVDDGGAASADRPTVVMYVTPTCPVCRRARSWLARSGVSFVERDISRDEGAARELQEKARRAGVRADGVPVFDVGGQLLTGFDERRLRSLLGI